MAAACCQTLAHLVCAMQPPWTMRTHTTHNLMDPLEKRNFEKHRSIEASEGGWVGVGQGRGIDPTICVACCEDCCTCQTRSI